MDCGKSTGHTLVGTTHTAVLHCTIFCDMGCTWVKMCFILFAHVSSEYVHVVKMYVKRGEKCFCVSVFFLETFTCCLTEIEGVPSEGRDY